MYKDQELVIRPIKEEDLYRQTEDKNFATVGLIKYIIIGIK